MKSKILKAAVLAILFAVVNTFAADKPNVIIFMTDDQGYGDLSSHGNPVLKTPAMDKLREDSVRFTDFHVAPKCTPTRGQLMSGLDALRNGATRVCQGLSMMHSDIKIMPQYFKESGYTTGLFGKWHLGDSYPHRPRFRGFDEVVSIRAWGITSLADYYTNTYFDPMLMHNGVDKPYKGYCTDIFFDEAMTWMDKCKSEEKPFFLFLPTNTPHVPNIVDEEFSAPYKGEHNGKAIPDTFFGMIANLDYNLEKLEKFLKEKDLKDNTILMFLSDNGTQSMQAKVLHNVGMRDKKGALTEGGHRVHFFVRWVDGKLVHGADVPELVIVQDILPTLVDLCGLKGDISKLDGVSFAPLLKGTKKKLEDRICVTQFGPTCEEWQNTVVMKDKWRLLRKSNSFVLYDVSKDPHQDNDVSAQHPEITKQLTVHYDGWFKKAKPEWDRIRYIHIGNDAANPLTLYASDWVGGYCDRRGQSNGAKEKGYWNLVVEKSGSYEIELRRFPAEANRPIAGKQPKQRVRKPKGKRQPKPAPPQLSIVKAQLLINNFDQTVDLQKTDTKVAFTVNLKAGNTKLTANLLDENSSVVCGAMYVKVTRK